MFPGRKSATRSAEVFSEFPTDHVDALKAKTYYFYHLLG